MRELSDAEGRVWVAEIVSHGRTSGYLNPKVHRPMVQFTCQTQSAPRRYASLPVGRDSLEALSDGELLRVLNEATSP
jgi:hypothetical protein